MACNFRVACASGVYISEIAWMGTRASPSDEWIELFNPSAESVDLNNFVLKSEKDLIVTLSGKVGPKSYFLIERGDGLATSAFSNTQSGVWKQGLTNTGILLELIDAKGNGIDRLDFRGGWKHGNSKTRRSMERDPLDLDVWITSSATSRYLDRKGEAILGSPLEAPAGGSFDPVEPASQVPSNQKFQIEAILDSAKEGVYTYHLKSSGVLKKTDYLRVKAQGGLIWSEPMKRWLDASYGWNDYPRFQNELKISIKPKDPSLKLVIRHSRTMEEVVVEVDGKAKKAVYADPAENEWVGESYLLGKVLGDKATLSFKESSTSAIQEFLEEGFFSSGQALPAKQGSQSSEGLKFSFGWYLLPIVVGVFLTVFVIVVKFKGGNQTIT